MASSIKSIAIVGVTGIIGTYLTHALLAKNHLTITAISRQDSKAEFLPNIQAARFNYNDQGSITEALKGHDALIITTSIFAPKDTSAKLIKAAAAAGAPWILPNEIGMYNTDEAAKDTIGTSKKEDRELIESLGVSSWIGISCGFWYEHLLSNGKLYGIDINERKLVVRSLPVVTSGEQGAPTTLSAYRNRMVYVSSFAVNKKDMFESVNQVTGTTDDDCKITSEPVKQRYETARECLRHGDRVVFGRVLYTRYFYEDAGLFEKSHGLDTEKLGLPKEDLDQSTKKAVSLVGNVYWTKYGQ